MDFDDGLTDVDVNATARASGLSEGPRSQRDELLAPPEPDPLTEEARHGKIHFEEIGCADCHVPALRGPRGLVPAYTDMLLHDMGPDMADGIVQLEATGSEFRTQPLWGVAATAPYLHDGRADTLDEAIRIHGSEGETARDARRRRKLERKQQKKRLRSGDADQEVG